MNNRRDEVSATVGPEGYIYAIGGFGGTTSQQSDSLSSVERYNTDRGVWEEIGGMNEKRRSHTAVSLPNGVYAIGGYNGNNYLNTVERYDNEQDKWILVQSM